MFPIFICKIKVCGLCNFDIAISNLYLILTVNLNHEIDCSQITVHVIWLRITLHNAIVIFEI